MNLLEIMRYRDRSLECGSGVTSDRMTALDERWLGLELQPAPEPQIRLLDVLSLRPMAGFPDDLGWFATLPSSQAGAETGFIDVALEPSNQRGFSIWSRRVAARSGSLAPVFISWPAGIGEGGSRVDLVLHVPPSSAPVFLAVSRQLKRSAFISPISGRGVEIGPGMTPQILPSQTTDVLYVDERPVEEWRQAYDYKREKWAGGDVAVDWERYRAGGALELPVEAGSLDFIFGSHVFEHLANPVRHLANWLGKLRSGGQIHMIVPNGPASVDFRQAPSRMASILIEAEQGLSAPTLKHYQRMFGASAAPAMRERRSLHVHFYDAAVLGELLAYADAELGAGGHVIHHRRNYREMFFTLRKA